MISLSVGKSVSFGAAMFSEAAAAEMADSSEDSASPSPGSKKRPTSDHVSKLLKQGPPSEPAPMPPAAAAAAPLSRAPVKQ